MKKGFVFSLLAVLAIAGCQTKELDYAPQPESKQFTATIEDDFNGGDTRTYMDENGNVRWKQGDQVSIFAGSTVNEQYQVTDASDGKTAAAFNKVSGGGFVGGGEIDNNVAFYPYAATAEIAKSGSSYVISDISLPATQNYAEASFGNGAFPMSAVTTSTTDMHLKFKNILGGLKLQLKGTACIASISITGNQNEVLCGVAEVTVSNGSAPSINLTDATAKTVTLNCGTGVQLNAETATPFVIALPPMTMEGGFTVVVTDTEGKQMEISTTKPQTVNRSKLLKMPAVIYEGVIMIQNPLSFESTGETSISLTKVGTPDDVSLEYKVNNGGWTSYAIGNDITLINGETVSFRSGANGNSSFSKSYRDYYKFVVTGSGSVAASGNIMSLLGQNESTTIASPYIFCSLFDNCTSLTSAPALPATTLANFCYYEMFSGCTSLTAAPELPATSLAEYCYSGMFVSCTSLTTAPDLPVTTLKDGCYVGMFSGCTSLTTAPELPATTLAGSCYADMFSHCTSLTTAPVLPATTLAQGCYDYMFWNCTSLTSAPVLPATKLEYRCYAGMFWGCSNLTTAPELPATTLVSECYMDMFGGCSKLTTAPVLPALYLAERCYMNMFKNCTKLNYVKALFTTSPYYFTEDWLFGVSATGTFVKNIDAKWDNRDAIPSGWTVITFAPDFVDLGLSVKWARYNLSESGLCANPEDYGDYYAWGETETYYTRKTPWFSWKDDKSEGYRWASYKWCDGSDRTLTKYNPSSSYGAVDNKVVLEEADDVAHVKLGGSWRMPTGEEWRELVYDCTWTWVTDYNGSGINGCLVTAYNGNSIFLPAAGSLSGNTLYDKNEYGYYWSSSLYTSIPYRAFGGALNSDGGYGGTYGGGRSDDYRYIGRSVRPVCPTD